MRVRKRSGEIQQFDNNRVKRCILMAFSASKPDEIPDTSPLVRSVTDTLIAEGHDDPIDVEKIQDIVERVLMYSGHGEVARSYIIYRHERDEARKRRLTPDSGALSDYIHAAKYAKYIPEKYRREVFEETVTRNRDMHIRRYPELRSKIDDAFAWVRSGHVLPSMRAMQFGGAAIEKNHARMYNCSFTLIDRERVFQEIFFLLLSGCGVGYSVQWCHVEKLPAFQIVDTSLVYHHKIDDTIEGWADALGALVKGGLMGYYVEFDYSEIRPEGSVLKTSGGKAPGHLPLKKCLEEIRERLNFAAGRKLRPIEAHDIICLIALAVLSGGVRRSSLISLFSADDTEMMYAKAAGNFDPLGLNHQRVMANNSAVIKRGSGYKEVFDRVNRISAEGYGEPGFFFTNHEDYGCNPCAEIGLYPVDDGNRETGFSFCNLCEVNVAKCRSTSEFYAACEAAAAIGTLQASYTSFPYLGDVTERIARRDALLGVGLTGMADNPKLAFDPDVLGRGTDYVRDSNTEWAGLLSINTAARLTTVKPSGTASLVLGCVGSGIHPHHARRYFRRVTANPNESIAQKFAEVNPHMVEYKANGDWALVFPIQTAEDAITIKEEDAISFLERVRLVYDNWVVPGTRRGDLTHNVSATATLREGDARRAMDYVWANRWSFAALSTAPFILDKKYPHAPREEVTPDDESRWQYLIRNYVDIDWSAYTEEQDNTSRRLEVACAGGTCEL